MQPSELSERSDVQLLAFCLMPNHIHRDLGVTTPVSGMRLVLATLPSGGSFAAYASAIDEATNDPRTLLPR